MKVLVYFQPKDLNKENFEGNRLARTICSSLEALNIEHTSKLVDDYDVAHFISPEDEAKVDVALEKNVPIIVSAMYCEDDPIASYIEYKNKDGERTYTLKPKAIKLLNKADLVLVPCQKAREFLLENGVTAPIQIVIPGISMARFDFSREDERNVFYRYFVEDKEKKLVVAIGEYTNDMDGINAFIKAGKKNPNAVFYYFGDMKKKTSGFKKVLKNATDNVHFSGLVPDDVYRSALLNADIFMFTGYHNIGVMTLIEAMAAKCQLIVRSKEMISQDILTNEENAYVAQFSETLTSLVNDCLEGKIPSTVEKAYQEMCENTYPAFGEKLRWFYQEEINKKQL